MLLNNFFFYFFSTLAVASAFLMVTRRNIVHAAICLVATLLATGGIFLQLEAQFLFIVQVFAFAGGTMVMFVMLITIMNLDIPKKVMQFDQRRVIASALALVLGAQVLFALFIGRGSLRFAAPQADISPRNTEAVGEALLHQFIVPFEIASILLLVAMLGAAVMATRKA